MLDDKTLGINVKKQLGEIDRLKTENTKLDGLLKVLTSKGSLIALTGKDFDNSNGSYKTKDYRERGVHLADALFMSGEKYDYLSILVEKLRDCDQTVADLNFRAWCIYQDYEKLKKRIKSILEDNTKAIGSLKNQVNNTREKALKEYMAATAAKGIG